MEITKDVFFQFLKDNDFYEEWLEGYQIDCDLFEDNVPLDEFFERCEKITWLYHGPGICSELINQDYPFKERVERHTKWREKNLSKYMDLDEKWMDFVNENKNI